MAALRRPSRTRRPPSSGELGRLGAARRCSAFGDASGLTGRDPFSSGLRTYLAVSRNLQLNVSAPGAAAWALESENVLKCLKGSVGNLGNPVRSRSAHPRARDGWRRRALGPDLALDPDARAVVRARRAQQHVAQRARRRRRRRGEEHFRLLLRLGRPPRPALRSSRPVASPQSDVD